MTDNEATGPSLKLFAFLSAVYILWAVAGAWYRHYFRLSLSPAEWATILEGVFSPLAFLWLLYAALSQRAELALQRSELQQNNETQYQQQRQMQRQADALESQIKALSAQSDAQYEPIFIFKRFTEPSRTRNIFLVNVGSSIVSVSSTENAAITGVLMPSATQYKEIHRGIVPYLPKDGEVVVALSNMPLEITDTEFTLKFVRLDASSFIHKYRWIPSEHRVQLVTRVQVA